MKTSTRIFGILALATAAAGTAAAAPDKPAAGVPTTGHARVNGLEMYYEIHGRGGTPLVLLHGAICTIDTCFGGLIPELAKTRQVIAIEQQAHGHTADIDRPLSVSQMTEDTVAALKQLGVTRADFFGYSMGAAIGLELAIRHPELVNRIVLASVVYDRSGVHPGILDGLDKLTPDMLKGTPWYEAYIKVAPRPAQWASLIEKIKKLDDAKSWPTRTIQALPMPVQLVIGDSDIVRPEHAIEMFRLLGGGVAGDVVGPPRSQLAVIPGATHVTLVSKVQMLTAAIVPFLDAPAPKAPPSQAK
jgi:pimeloyl-ACP methyl ester carboxylesterase